MLVCDIGLGSNLGDRKEYIRLAIEKIRELKETRVTKISSLIETEPVGGPPQEKFFNAAIEIQTNLSAPALLRHLQKIESQLGRVRTVKNGPRTIDLDILFYGDKQINQTNLIVPHPRIKEREFVLAPLREIAPGIAKKLFDEDSQKDR
jgi:2-amino-4-hydroxy-6-hydroxymethyldihydropteridine diphosphokinase